MASQVKQAGAIVARASAAGNKPATSSREKILDAAVQVAIRDGILAMTLDAVAREAGVSKGGLIHHFRSKDDLIAAMLEAFRLKALGALETRMAGDPNPHGRWFRALVNTVFPAQTDYAAVPRPSEMARFLTAILAASANNPQLIHPVRNNLAQMLQTLFAEGPNGRRQVALWPAIYGLLLWQQLGVLVPGGPVFRSIVDELLHLAEGPAIVPAVSQEGPGRTRSKGSQGAARTVGKSGRRSAKR